MAQHDHPSTQRERKIIIKYYIVCHALFISIQNRSTSEWNAGLPSKKCLFLFLIYRFLNEFMKRFFKFKTMTKAKWYGCGWTDTEWLKKNKKKVAYYYYYYDYFLQCDNFHTSGETKHTSSLHHHKKWIYATSEQLFLLILTRMEKTKKREIE